MFGTWKYDPETDEVQNLRRAFDPVTARSSQHQACNRCHEKKLKCSGEKEGCERCVANDLRCEYTRSDSRSSRRGKKNRQKSTDSGREDSPSTSSAPHARKSSSRRAHHGQASSSSRSRAVATSSADEPEGLLGQLDFSVLGPEDGFDLNLLSAGGEASSGDGGYAATAAHHHHHHHHHHHSQISAAQTAYQQQWADHGYATSGASSYSHYVPTTTAGEDYASQGYGDYQGYYQANPGTWPPGDR